MEYELVSAIDCSGVELFQASEFLSSSIKMQLIIFMGLQASGKSTFYREKFIDSHIRLNLDMLKTRHREKILFNACLEAKQSVVIDNTNPSLEDRQKYIKPAGEFIKSFLV